MGAFCYLVVAAMAAAADPSQEKFDMQCNQIFDAIVMSISAERLANAERVHVLIATKNQPNAKGRVRVVEDDLDYHGPTVKEILQRIEVCSLLIFLISHQNLYPNLYPKSLIKKVSSRPPTYMPWLCTKLIEPQNLSSQTVAITVLPTRTRLPEIRQLLGLCSKARHCTILFHTQCGSLATTVPHGMQCYKRSRI